MRDLAAGPRRFVELQRVLPGISTEQLRSRLNRMVADGMLTRKRYREVPPRVDYELTERARELMPILGALARWGYEWAWSPPRASESVDLGAIFRLAPGLIAQPAAGLRVGEPVEPVEFHPLKPLARGRRGQELKLRRHRSTSTTGTPAREAMSLVATWLPAAVSLTETHGIPPPQ